MHALCVTSLDELTRVPAFCVTSLDELAQVPVHSLVSQEEPTKLGQTCGCGKK